MNASDDQERRFFAQTERDDLSSYAHRQLIGAVGLLLPILLWLIAGWRHTAILPAWKPLGSVSAYYYTGAVSFFAGALVALALFLFSYRGYQNEYGHRDRVAAVIAGGAAILVAFFPTDAPTKDLSFPWWTPPMGVIHYLAAVALFGSFIFFSLIQFPKSNVKKGNPVPMDKRVRNSIYIVCGVAMIACMAWAAISSWRGGSIFWPEVLALEFFAISWLAKGRADKTAVAVGKQTLHYGRHPQQLVSDVWDGVRGAPSAQSKAKAPTSRNEAP